MEKPNEIVVVLDFGGQYNQLIARRVRDLGVYSELMPYHTPVEKIKRLNPKGIIFSGGPASVYAEGAPLVDPAVYELGIPILGICYGMQMMTHQLNGKVERANVREYGKAQLKTMNESLFYDGLDQEQTVWMSHSDKVIELPPGFQQDATNEACPVAAMSHPEKKFYGVQFHPEVRHSLNGNEMIKNFLFKICECEGKWSMDAFVEQVVRDIREKVGKRKVLCALSGGVDSSVVAVLVHKAIGDQLTCMFGRSRVVA